MLAEDLSDDAHTPEEESLRPLQKQGKFRIYVSRAQKRRSGMVVSQVQVLLERPEIDGPIDPEGNYKGVAYEIAFKATRPNKLASSVPADILTIGALLDGFQNEEGMVINGMGRPLDIVHKDGSITEGRVNEVRNGVIDFRRLGEIARNLKRGR